MATRGKAVTVVVPVYKGGALARKAIQSLVDQIYEPVEILVINDGSPLQEDRMLADEFSDSIRYIEQDNRGLCATLNRAIFELVSTPLIARLDQDDFSAADRLLKQVELLEKENAEACFCPVNKVTVRSKTLARHPQGLSEPVEYSPRLHGCIVHSTLLARVDFLRALGGYDPELYPCDDLDLSIRMSQAGKVIVHPEAMVNYLIHGDASTFSTFWQMAIKTKYLQQYLDTPNHRERFASWYEREGKQLANNSRERRLGYGRMFYRRAGYLIGTGQYLRGATYLMATCALHPRYFFSRFKSSLHLWFEK